VVLAEVKEIRGCFFMQGLVKVLPIEGAESN